MSKADKIFIENCRDILKNGVWDKDYDVRPAHPHTPSKSLVL